jgi:transcription initiation factor TFIID TATA-box-binding protein
MRKRKYSSLPAGQFSSQSLGDYDNIPLPTVHNIVATSQIVFSTLKSLDLNRIHEMLPFSFYDQHKFAAITVRLHQPDCTTLLFSSGKLVVTGCRTWYECVYASLFVARILEECIPGHSFKLCACDVQNMVAHVEIPVNGGCLDLHGMYARMSLNCTYQRKMFPGLIYRPEASPVVLLCFFSGKIVITGGKTMEDVFAGWKRLWPTLQAFVLPKPPPAQQAIANSSSSPSVLDDREQYQSLPLEWDAVACDAGGCPDTLVEPARCDGGGGEAVDFTDACKLEGFCDDFATEGHALVLRGGLTGGTAEKGGEPGGPHPSFVKGQLLPPDGSTVL